MKINNYTDYFVYSNGEIYSIKSKRFLKKEITHKGYFRVSLCKNGKSKRFAVHRLVAEHFLPKEKNKPLVCHNDSNPKNNSVYNLRWDNAFGNMRDRKNRGLYCQIGEKNYSAKLVENDVIEIRKLLEIKSVKKVWELFKHKVSLSTIYDIHKKRSWNHI